VLLFGCVLLSCTPTPTATPTLSKAPASYRTPDIGPYATPTLTYTPTPSGTSSRISITPTNSPTPTPTATITPTPTSALKGTRTPVPCVGARILYFTQSDRITEDLRYGEDVKIFGEVFPVKGFQYFIVQYAPGSFPLREDDWRDIQYQTHTPVGESQPEILAVWRVGEPDYPRNRGSYTLRLVVAYAESGTIVEQKPPWVCWITIGLF